MICPHCGVAMTPIYQNPTDPTTIISYKCPICGYAIKVVRLF